MTAVAAAHATAPTQAQARSAWLKLLLQWHWISSAVCLVGLLMFSITGLTLNNAGLFDSKARVEHLVGELPPALKPLLAGQDSGMAALPAPLAAWLSTHWQLDLDGRLAEWSEDEVYVTLPRPGGDAWLRIDRASAAIEMESSDRGWVAYFNDLHKGRHAGKVWSWFLDVFAMACLVFALSGLLILKVHALKRPLTWPLVGLGLVLPALLMLFLIR